jgi:hypothetical protein
LFQARSGEGDSFSPESTGSSLSQSHSVAVWLPIERLARTP